MKDDDNEPDLELLQLGFFFREGTTVTKEELDYFRKHPEQIEEVSAPVNIHIRFLWAGALLGGLLVGVSKALKFSGALDVLALGVQEFFVDIVFEVGVAFIGAAATAFILGILLNRQQKNAAAWRADIRRKLGAKDPESDG